MSEKEPKMKVKKTISFGDFMAAIGIFALISTFGSLTIRHYGIQNAKSKMEIEQKQAVNSMERFKDRECAEKVDEALESYLRGKKADFTNRLSSTIHKLQPRLDLALVEKITTTIIAESEAKGLDPILVTALIYEESAFNPMARSKRGAIGLMQIRYKTWKGSDILKGNGVSAKNKLYWIDLNIKCGTDILAQYYKESDSDMVRALNKYHSGRPDLPKNKKYYEVDYVNKVLIKAHKISEMMKAIPPVEWLSK